MQQATDRACPYCGDRMPNTRRVQCGKPECTRRYQAERTAQWMREYKAKSGESYAARYPRTMYHRKCAVCGTPFKSTTPHAKYCSTGADSCEMKGKGYATRAERAERWFARLLRAPSNHDIGEYNRALRADPCAYCGAAAEASDHIDPKSHGGSNDWTNRTAACHACNGSKMQTPLLIFLAWKRARDEFEPWRQIVAAIHTR